MKTSRLLVLIVTLITIAAIGTTWAADLSDLYFGTVYKRFLIIRNGDNTDVTGLPATTPSVIYDGAWNASPLSMSQEVVLITGDLQLQFRDDNQFIQSDGATTLLIDGNSNLQLTGTVVTVTGDLVPGADGTYDLGTSLLEWEDLYIDGTAYLDAVDIDDGSITGTSISGSTGSFTTLQASGDVSFDGGTFSFNETRADLDFTFAGDTAVYLLFGDASADQIGINTNTPSATLDIVGTLEVSSTSAFTGAITATGGLVGDITGDLTGDVTSSGTSSLATLTVSGTSTLSGNLIFDSADILIKSGNSIDFDDDSDVTGFVSNVDNTLTVKVGGTTELLLDNDAFMPGTNDDLDLGSTTYKFKDLFLSGDASIYYAEIEEFVNDGSAIFSGTFTATTADFDDLVTISDLLAFNGTPEAQDGAGAINATTTWTHVKSDGANALTINAGATEGQIKIITMVQDGGDATLSTGAGATVVGTSLLFDDVGESAILQWDHTNSKWYVISTSGASWTP